MPFALLTIGLIFVVVGFQDTYKQFGNQVVSDFTGQKSFFWWLVAIGAVGALGYVKDLRTFSRAFMALIVVSIFLSNQGFFQNFISGINTGATAPVDPIGTALPATGSGASSGGGGGGGDAGSFLSDAIPIISSFF